MPLAKPLRPVTKRPVDTRGCPDVSFIQVKTQKMYEVVVQQLEGMINRGELRPGDTLPSERDLTERLGVSRGVLSQAFRVLEEEGIIQVRPGSGRMVREAPSRGGDHVLVVRRLERAAIMDLIEVRDTLEGRIAQLACERATPGDLEAMRGVLDRCRAKVLDANLDEEFHLALAQATQNVVFANMLRLSLNLLRKTRERTFRLPGNPAAMLEEHQAIYNAVAGRDPVAATQAVSTHLEGIKTRLALTRVRNFGVPAAAVAELVLQTVAAGADQ